MDVKYHPPGGVRTHDLSTAYRAPLAVFMYQIVKTMHLNYVSIYIRAPPNQEIVYKNDNKIRIEDVLWRPFEFYDLG